MNSFGINISKVSFSYDDYTVISNLTISIPKNQIWALVGRSGVGKTTLLHIISGLYKPIAGEIMVHDRPEGVGRINGIVFQEESLLGWLTVEENLLFPEHKRPNDEQKTNTNNLIVNVGLDGWQKTYPHQLSAGMKKRLEFARALYVDTKYILADEPFGTVDALTRRSLWKLWRKIRQESPRTGILSTHDPEEAIRLCDKIIVLNDSRDGASVEIIPIPKEIQKLDIGSTNSTFTNLQMDIIRSLENGN